MAEQLLDLANVGLLLQQVSGAGVAQRVRRDVLGDARSLGGLAHDPHDVIVREWLSASAGDEQGRLRSRHDIEAARFRQIELERGYRALRQWYESGDVPLAVLDAKCRRLHLYIIDRQVEQFLTADARRI